MADGSSFVEIACAGRSARIEYAWIAAERAHAPLVVFLHEGLGSLAMWKDYPQRLCDAAGARGLVFSRAGYGRSAPRRPEERWQPDFMHVEARDALPSLFERLAVGADGARPWLFGHSDGASIALIHAASFPDALAGVIAVAPHVFVEDVSIRSIEAMRDAYRATDLRARLARYHDDPDSAFFGWNDIWLDPRFRGWSIEAMLADLRCPILALQGENDEYGTLAQIERLRQCARQTEQVVLAQCGHSPHRDQPEALTRVVTDFIVRQSKALTWQGGM